MQKKKLLDLKSQSQSEEVVFIKAKTTKTTGFYYADILGEQNKKCFQLILRSALCALGSTK